MIEFALYKSYDYSSAADIELSHETVHDFTCHSISSNTGSTGSIPVMFMFVGARPLPSIVIVFRFAPDCPLLKTISSSTFPPAVSTKFPEVPALT